MLLKVCGGGNLLKRKDSDILLEIMIANHIRKGMIRPQYDDTYTKEFDVSLRGSDKTSQSKKTSNRRKAMRLFKSILDSYLGDV